MGSELGIDNEKLRAIPDYKTNPLFDAVDRLVLEYADAMTITGLEVSDELFARLRGRFGEEEIVELTEIIAFENCSSKFNRALRVPSQRLWGG